MINSKYFNKTVLITGSSRGVGLHLAEYFLTHGARVLGLSRNTPNIKYANYNHYTVDLSTASDIINTFKKIGSEHSKIDIVINNAAILTSHYAVRIPLERAIEMVTVNLLGVFLVSREAFKLMESGRIINIGSMAQSLEPMGDSLYAATKSGINTMANIMAKEFSVSNVTCNTLAISAIETDMLKQLNKEKIDKVVAGLPIPRYATMSDIINVIDFFASDESSYITAQTIYLGGVS